MSESKFDARYASVMRGWHDLNAQEHPEDEKIIDMDLAPDGPRKQYESEDEVRSDLEDLGANVPSSEANGELLTRMIGANILYLRAVQGEDIDFITYGEGTVGITPRPIEEAVIESGASTLDMLLKDEGLGYDPAFRDTFHDKFSLRGQNDIKRAYNTGLMAVRSALGRRLRVPADNFSTVFEEVDDFWAAYLDGTIDDLNLIINTRKPISGSQAEIIAAHEYGGHAAHLWLWNQAIRAIKLNPAIGLTAAHTPYAFQAEALAQTAEHIMPADSPVNIFQALHNQQVGRVLHNMHYQVNTGTSLEAAQAYGQERLPLDTGENTTLEMLEKFRDKPFYRAYYAAYAPSLEVMRPVRSLTADSQRSALRTLYTGAFTPEQIAQVVSNAVQNDLPFTH